MGRGAGSPRSTGAPQWAERLPGETSVQLKGLTWREAPGDAAELPEPFCQESTSVQKAEVSGLASLVS